MGEYEEFVQELRYEGMEELASRAEKYSNQEMRKRVGNVATVEKERDELRAEIAGLRATPKRSEALKKAGVDLAALQDNPAALEAIERQRLGEGKEYDEEWAKSMVEKYRLPVAEGTGETTEPPPNADPFTKPGTQPGASTKTGLSPLEVKKWDPQKRMRFIEYLDKNGKMDVLDRLLQGETVTGITFS